MQRIFRVRAVQELTEVSARSVVDTTARPGTCLEYPEETRQQVITVFRDIVEKRIGKSLGIRPFDVVQHGADGARYGAFVHAAGHAAIKAERGELPLQHGGCIQEDARRVNPAAEHLQRLGVVIEVVRLSGRDGQRQRVAVTPTRASGALHVVHRCRGHRAHHDGGEVADVHPELKGRRCGQQVGLPGPGVRSGEPFLQTIPLLAGHQSSVLGRHDAVDVPPLVQPSRPGRTPGFPPDVAVLRRPIEARDALPQLGFAGRNHDRPSGFLAVHDGGFGRDVESPGVERPYLRAARRNLGHQSRGTQRVHHDVQDVRRIAGCRKVVDGLQHLRGPGLVPGTASTYQCLHAVPIRCRRGKHRQRGAWPEVLQGDVADRERVAAVAQISAKQRTRNGAAIPHPAQHSQDQAAHARIVDCLQLAEFLANSNRCRVAGTVQRLSVEAHRGESNQPASSSASALSPIASTPPPLG